MKKKRFLLTSPSVWMFLLHVVDMTLTILLPVCLILSVCVSLQFFCVLNAGAHLSLSYIPGHVIATLTFCSEPFKGQIRKSSRRVRGPGRLSVPREE